MISMLKRIIPFITGGTERLRNIIGGIGAKIKGFGKTVDDTVDYAQSAARRSFEKFEEEMIKNPGNYNDPIPLRIMSYGFNEALNLGISLFRGVRHGLRSSSAGKEAIGKMTVGGLVGYGIGSGLGSVLRGVGRTARRASKGKVGREFVSSFAGGTYEAARGTVGDTFSAARKASKAAGMAIFSNERPEGKVASYLYDRLGFDVTRTKPLASNLIFTGIVAGGLTYGAFQGWNDSTFGVIDNNVAPMSGTYGGLNSPYLNDQLSVNPSPIDDLGADGELTFALHNLR